MQIKNGAIISPSQRSYVEARITDNEEDLRLPEGMQVARFHNTGMLVACQVVKGTRRFSRAYGVHLHAVEVYKIDTVVRDGALWGICGPRVKGRRWIVREDSLTSQSAAL